MAQGSVALSNAARPEPRSLCILVADDEPDIVATLAALFHTEGHAVHGVYRGTDVLPALRLHRPDVCILDVDLPGPSGFALAREIRTLYGPQAPLLIAISGKFTGQTDRMLGELAGFDHYRLKPCDPQDLIELLLGAPPSSADGRPDPTFAKAFVRAAELLGGSEALVRHLGVRRHDLLAWMTGSARPPMHVFLRTVDVLLHHLRSEADQADTLRPAGSDTDTAL